MVSHNNLSCFQEDDQDSKVKKEKQIRPRIIYTVNLECHVTVFKIISTFKLVSDKFGFENRCLSTFIDQPGKDCHHHKLIKYILTTEI